MSRDTRNAVLCVFAWCLLVALCCSARAADWELTQPSVDPDRYGFATGTFSSPLIRENGANKRWVNENLRHKFIETANPSNQIWGHLDNRGEVLNSLTNLVSFGWRPELNKKRSGMAYTKSILKPKWDYIAPGQTKFKPTISLEWSIDNKCSAPEGVPVISAMGYGAVSGSISQTVKRSNAAPNTFYRMLTRVRLRAEFIPANPKKLTTHPSLTGRLRYRSGQSYIDAKFVPNIPDGVGHGWVVVRHTRKSTGGFYDKTYTYPGYTLSPPFLFGCYAQTTGSSPLDYEATVGKSPYPQNALGQWEDITADNDTTVMKSTSYPKGTTGADPWRDEVWSGSITIIPAVYIKHP